jgi:hypothetical protein
VSLADFLESTKIGGEIIPVKTVSYDEVGSVVNNYKRI